MSLLTQKPKFLLDENVHQGLFLRLRGQKFDVTRAPKGATDKTLAQQSLEEQRILVTNDEDFSWYAPSEIFGVIWLRLPQHDAEMLYNSFTKLLAEHAEFGGKLISLKPSGWDETSLGNVKFLPKN